MKPRFLMSRRKAIGLGFAAFGGSALYSCAKPQGRSEAQSAETNAANRVSASMGISTWIGYTPLYIAKEKGFYEEFGLALDLPVFNAWPDALAAFASGRLDGLSPVSSEAVLLAAQGKDYRVVLVEDLSVGSNGILARNSVKSVEDFKGKSIAVEQGGVNHFFLLQVLAETGLTAEDVTLVNMTADASAAAYQAGKIDIAVTFSPFLEQGNSAQTDGRIIYDSSSMPTAIIDLYIFDTKFIEDNPNAIMAFVKGTLKGLDFLNSNPDEGLAIASKPLGTTPEDLAVQLQGIQLTDKATNAEMLGNPESDLYLVKAMAPLAEFLKAQGQIETIPDLSKIPAPQFVQES